MFVSCILLSVYIELTSSRVMLVDSKLKVCFDPITRFDSGSVGVSKWFPSQLSDRQSPVRHSCFASACSFLAQTQRQNIRQLI
jgi:hypothetical protein